MEVAIIVIVIVIVSAYYGFFNSFEVAADMANNELKDKADEQKVRLITNKSKRAISKETYDKAVEQKALLDAFEL